MKFTNDEKLLALVAVLHAPDGSAVPMDVLKLFFDRPGRLAAAAKSMIRWDMASAPAGMNSLRINREKLLTALALKKPVELFLLPAETGEHAGNGNSCVPAHKNGESFAPMPKPKPPNPDPPPDDGNPSKSPGLCGISLRSLRSENFADSLRKPGDLPVAVSSLKERHKGIKPLMDFESLSHALLLVESGKQPDAYFAMCGILGGLVMEGGDRGPDGEIRLGDGGKWRNRWIINRKMTHRVLADLVAQIKEGAVKSRGGRAESLWQEFNNR